MAPRVPQFPRLPPIASSLFLPLKYEDRITGVMGCFSTNFSEFNYFDQQLLDLIPESHIQCRSQHA